MFKIWTFFSLIIGDWHTDSSEKEIMAHQKRDFMTLIEE
jgi:hypothetical protein